MENDYHIIYEDDALLVLNKSARIAVQSEVKEESLEAILKEKCPNLGIIHRLDQRVSGLVIFGKTAFATARLSDYFANQHVDKFYRAVIKGFTLEPNGRLQHWLVKTGNKSKAYTIDVKEGKKSTLNYKTLDKSDRYSLLEIELETGRFHQIRAQFAKIGLPIVGDLKYGYPRNSIDGSIFLQAHKLSFLHPITKERLSFEIDMPESWKKLGF